MASNTRAVSGALTERVSLMTWLTVAVETPARSATLRIVATLLSSARRRAVNVYALRGRGIISADFPRVNDRARARLLREIPPFQPGAESIQPRKEHALRDICLVELVAHFPLQIRRDDDPTKSRRAFEEPGIEERSRTRHEGEERELVHDPGVQRRGLQEDDKLAREAIQLLERLCRVLEKLGGEDIGAFRV